MNSGRHLFPTLGIPLVAGVIWLSWAATPLAVAQTDETVPSQTESSENQPEQPSPTSQESSRDDMLLQQLEGRLKTADDGADAPAEPASEPPASSRDDASSPAEDQEPGTGPLQTIAQRMRSVQRRMTDRDTGEQTQQLQDQIIHDLEELIELARQQPPAPSQSSSAQASQQLSQQRRDTQQATGDPMNAQQASGDSGGAPRKQSSSADTTTEQTGPGNQAEAELDRRRRYINEVWGHLPPTLRRELLNIDSEQYLPKYDTWVRRYYESLAEPQKPREPR